jgi:hypothetical protein
MNSEAEVKDALAKTGALTDLVTFASAPARGSGNVAYAAGTIVTNPNRMQPGAAIAASAAFRTFFEAIADVAHLHFRAPAPPPEVR